MGFFEVMEPLEKIFWYVALPTSIVFIIQTIMTFVGGDSGDGTDADFDGDLNGDGAPFQLFSLRNIINFLLGFSWAGISFYKMISNHPLLIILSFLIGIGFVLLFFVLIKQMQRLAEDNSFKISDTVGKTGTVYLKIPEKKSGQGKIQVSVKGTFHELYAVTEYDEIESGKMIKVLAVLDDNLLLVTNL